jgi:hypothetical protein
MDLFAGNTAVLGTDLHASASTLLAFATLISVICFVVSTFLGGVTFRGHWGGFGNGSGGWQFSRSGSFLIAAVAFGALLALSVAAGGNSKTSSGGDLSVSSKIEQHESAGR